MFSRLGDVRWGDLLRRVRRRPSWQFFAAMTRAVPGLAGVWWLLLAVRALIPAAIAVSTGWLVGTVQSGGALGAPLVAFALVFLAAQLSPGIHQAVGTLLGHRFSSHLNNRLMAATLQPAGIGHLERGELANDLKAARDFDEGWTGPPMYLNMDFIAAGLVQLLGGIFSALVLFGFSWWAPLVLLAAWTATHYLLRESGVWRDRNTHEVKTARRHTDYAYGLATEPVAAKEVRLFGWSSWLLDRFTTNRLRLHELQYRATKLRERPLIGALLLVLAANVLVFVVLAIRAYAGVIGLQQVVTYAGAAFGASMLAFGGLSWAMDGAAAPVVALNSLEPVMAEAGRLTVTDRPAGASAPDTGVADGAEGADRGSQAPQIDFQDVSFGYPGAGRQVLTNFNLSIPAGTSMAIVGQNGAGKTTIAKLLCRLYDPVAGRIQVDGVDLRELELPHWRRSLAAVFQDFVRYELPLRDNIAPLGAPDEQILAALQAAGADGLASLNTPMAKAYPGGRDVSGGQWQRIALARAVAKVAGGARVVLLDEPTAMLDVRGEREIFRRLLEATAGTTRVLISHRFSTVRLADHICVMQDGEVVELGTHDELMARGGHYQRLYDLQASRFTETDEDGEQVTHDVL